MGIELSQEQHAVLKETRAVATPAEFQALLDAARSEMDRIVREVMEPSQPISTTLTELRDLYLAVVQYEAALASKAYGPERRALLRGAMQLLDTANLWFGEGRRTGAYQVRPIDQVIKASRPWRARLKAFADQAFAFEPDVAEQFADVNTTGTLTEETSDLAMLLRLAKQHQARLAPVGLTEDFLREGSALLDEVSGRDLLGILGLRNREEAMVLRNSIVTYATLLGNEARAADVNACWDLPEAKRRFSATSFRNALRRLRPKRRGSAAAPDEPAPVETKPTDAKPADAKPAEPKPIEPAPV
ncbi:MULTISPECIES: hypothetical protein [Sorangium]|uniref:Uncharacterized protein n=1 Tax=Sorangium cellulosum TaxID=56 RepID=A0A4P2QSU7_SORCE|nr:MULTISPECIES: hypothetical protein [Sorangium]AUX32643.1 hypothetical protein SOCE836_047880 [Sorangium cellulosum]WCQ92019.1 hypothetical protein NQZ70_04748 [Sorangium sp. Soce836]